MSTTEQRSTIEDIYELSPLQHGMLFHSVHEPESGFYFEQEVFTVPGGLAASAFAECWQHIVNRHDVLRTSFHWQGLEKPLQVVNRDVKLPVQHLDLRSFTESEREVRLKSYLAADRQRGFDLSAAPLMRLHLFDVAADVSVFVWSFHHILLDGWSGQIVLKEAAAIYEAICRRQSWQLRETRRYRDFIAWLQQQDSGRAETYWKRALRGVTVPTPLGVYRRPSMVSATDREGECEVALSGAVTSSLQLFARTNRLTLNTIVQGAWALLLSRYSGETDVVFGTVVSGRPVTIPGIENMVGLFINTLPVRVRISLEMPVVSWLEDLQTTQSEAREYEYSSLVDVKRWSEVAFTGNLFDTVLVCENFPVNVADRNVGKAEQRPRYLGRTNYAITVMVMPGADLRLKFEYNTDLFDEATIARMAGHYQVLLEGIACNVEERIGRLPLLTAQQRRQLLVEWNATAVEYGGAGCIHQLFEQQAARTPEAMACVFEEAQLTYGELNRRANQLARHLQGLGVGPEVLVGIAMRRSLELMVALLGVLKAGGAYVPLDPSYPTQRLAFMLGDTQAPVVLTQQPLLESLPMGSAQVLCIDTQWPQIAQHDTGNLAVTVSGSNLAYVIYTSGSTGTPKGVCGLHRATLNRFHWMWRQYPFSAEERCCQKTVLGFVDSVWEIFGPLLQGIPTVLIAEPIVKDPQRLVRLLEENQVTRLVVVPSLLRVLLEEHPDLATRLPQLRYWISSGEMLPVELVQQFQNRLPGRTLVNLYGSSEVAADATWFEVGTGPVSGAVPIGRPIANMQAYILDPHLQPVPVGVAGELHLSGAGLARGYLRRPELTQERFVANPFGQDANGVLYKTGDLVRYRESGEIEYLGRIDQQVKIRGFRIELGEIEAALQRHPEIGEAVIVDVEEHAGERKLLAYVVAIDRCAPSAEELRGFLKRTLPEYMIPSVFVVIETLPHLPNGKVDRQRLRSLEGSPAPAHAIQVAPRNALEQTIAEMWQALLGTDRVGIHDNFFEAGGHSLLAIQLASRLRDAFQKDVTTKLIFEAPTIAQIAAFVDGRSTPDSDVIKALELVESLTEDELRNALQRSG